MSDSEETIVEPQDNPEKSEPQNTEANVEELDEHTAKAEEFSNKFEELIGPGVKIAVAIIVDPTTRSPIIYTRGSAMHLAKLTGQIYKHFHDAVLREIEP